MGAIYNLLASPFFLIRSHTHTVFYWWKTHGKVGALKERLALMCVDRVFTAGVKSFDIKSDKVRVVGHAIDVTQFPQTETHTPEHCLVVGRIVPIKKIEIALQAFKQIVGRMPNAVLSIVGKREGSEYEASLEDIIEKESLHQVRFLGAYPPHRMPTIYAQAGMLLHPAYEAGFDKVVLEAMLSGVIPITSIPSFSPILKPFGLYVERNDIAGYRETMLSLIHLKEAVRQNLLYTLRQIVIREHSLNTLPQRIFGV